MSVDKIRNFYDSRARTYGPTDEEGVRRYRAAISLARFSSQNVVLDVGCKLSVLPKLLVEREVPHQYFGTDLVVSGSDTTAPRNMVQSDVSEGLPFKSSHFSHVFCLELLEHVTSPLALLDEIYRVLRPGGQLLLSVPNPYYWAEIYGNIRGLGDTEGHISSFTPQNMRRLLGFASFEDTAKRGTYMRIPLLHRIRSSSLVEMKSWSLARSIVYFAEKGPEPLSA